MCFEQYALIGFMLNESSMNAYIENSFQLDTQLPYLQARLEEQLRCWCEMCIRDRPKLIIQPLVENAIEHGFISSEGGRIILSADLDEKEMYIAVTNTGRVIEAEQVEPVSYTHLGRDRGGACGGGRL